MLCACGCFLTGCFSQMTSDVLSTIPLLDGHCSAASACIQRCSLHPTLLPQLKGPFSRCRAPVLLLVGVLVFCVTIPTSHYSSSQKAKEWDVDACSLLTAWGGYGDVYTFLPHTFVLVLVGVLVSCVPIPTSHYSVPFSCSTFSLAALSWEKG